MKHFCCTTREIKRKSNVMNKWVHSYFMLYKFNSSILCLFVRLARRKVSNKEISRFFLLTINILGVIFHRILSEWPHNFKRNDISRNATSICIAYKMKVKVVRVNEIQESVR